MYLPNSKIATIKWTGFPAARTGCVGCRICPWLLVWCHMALRSPWSLGSVWLSPTQAHLPAEVWAGGKDKGKAKEKELPHFPLRHIKTVISQWPHRPLCGADNGARSSASTVRISHPHMELPLCLRAWLSVSGTQAQAFAKLHLFPCAPSAANAAAAAYSSFGWWDLGSLGAQSKGQNVVLKFTQMLF